MVSAAATDPFEKVRGLIEDMIAKLLADANEEEKAKSNANRDDKVMKLDSMQARLDKAKATSAELADKVKELQSELVEIDKATKESTKIRAEEHSTYEKAKKDYKEAAQAAEDAIGVLKDFYQSMLQEEDLALLQGSGASRSGRRQPEFGGAKADADKGVISLLEVCAEDFTRLLTEAQTDEMGALTAYNQMTQENKVAKVSKNAEMKAAESEIKQLAVAIRTYEEKKARREAEIQGLKEALAILAGGAAEPVLVQQVSGLRGGAWA